MNTISLLDPVSKNHKNLVYFLLVIAGFILLRNAWVGDDSYIGFRTSYNFAHGYGLTFNINERVQSFTNPLWTMIMGVLSIFTGEMYYTSIFLSLSITLFLLYWASLKIAKDVFSILLIFGFALTSKSFIDYSVSGLENPLGHLLIVLFVYVYFEVNELGKRLFLLAFISALAGVHRLDNLLLYFIPLLVEVVRHFSFRTFRIMALGFIPLMLWELFSLIYFGFLFPNTYYTKLNTGISGIEYFKQGLRYLVNSLNLDPVTLVSISFAIVLVVVYAVKKKNYRVLPLVGSVVLYLLYTVKVGGDFMSGRFLSTPFILSIVLLSRMEVETIVKYGMVGVIVLFAFVNPYCPIKSDLNYRKSDWGNYGVIVQNDGIADERGWYHPNTGFMGLTRNLFILNIERKAGSLNNVNDSIMHYRESSITLGFETYELGPNVFTFHHMGLSDALIARLPMDNLKNPHWRIGHFERKIPAGYSETLRTGINVIHDQNLARYYDKLKLIIRGDLFTWERIKTIYKMNTGRYDPLIDKEFYSGAKVSLGQGNVKYYSAILPHGFNNKVND